ncbi:MAG TPA: glycosyltransferase family A protein [Opitutaceae bacterium]|nr:glycosyltransferase family A protein [Opitutaceae bacterium]
MPDGLVSVLIPAYRASAYIGLTLESIAAQTYKNWEILVLEDGIFDDTAEKVRAFAATASRPVRLIQREKNQGVSRARNTLLDEARGQFIAFLDADDLWTPDHLEYSLGLMEKEGTDWVVGGLNLIDPKGRVTEADVFPPQVEFHAMPTRLLSYNFILPSGMVARADVFGGNLRFDPTLTIGEDLDLCIRIVETGHRVSYSQKATLNYRKHPSSATGDPARFSEGMSELYEKYLHNPLVDRKACANFLRQALLTTARITRKSQPQRCHRAAKRLIQLSPFSPTAWLYFLASRGHQTPTPPRKDLNSTSVRS